MDNKTRKTKVLFVITKSNFGGAQKYVYELATSIDKDLYDPVVALGGEGILIHKLEEAGIRVIRLNTLKNDLNPLGAIVPFMNLLAIMKVESPHIVHLNSSKIGVLGSFAARFAHIPKIIFTAHGWPFNEDRALWQRVFFRFFSWVAIILTHKTIAVSHSVKDAVSGWPLINNKVMVIKNGIKEFELLPKHEALSEIFSHSKISLPGNAFVVGTIAELHKNKGLPYAIEAFAEIVKKNNDAFYFIIGGGQERESLEKLIVSKKLEGRVLLCGFIDNAPRLLRAFDVFVLPSITEALGFVILEAGLAKLPVIATRVGGIPEIVEDGVTGILVPSRDSASISKAIHKLIDSTTLRTKLGENLFVKINKDFSFKAMRSSTEDLYEVE